MYSKKLSEACVDGDFETVVKILKKKIDLNDDNKMALSFASDRGHFEIVKVLLEHGG